jgi:hypothetical protein
MSQRIKERKKRLGPTITFEGCPSMYRPLTRNHILKVLPSPNCVALGKKASNFCGGRGGGIDLYRPKP